MVRRVLREEQRASRLVCQGRGAGHRLDEEGAITPT